jgi:hypothetical protein
LYLPCQANYNYLLLCYVTFQHLQGHSLSFSHLHQPSASFAAKAALDHDSDEDPIKPTTIINKNKSATASHNGAAHDAEQHSAEQQLEGDSGAAASTGGMLPHDVRMVMRTHAYPAAYLEAISPRHLPPDKVRSGWRHAALHGLLDLSSAVLRTT